MSKIKQLDPKNKEEIIKILGEIIHYPDSNSKENIDDCYCPVSVLVSTNPVREARLWVEREKRK